MSIYYSANKKPEQTPEEKARLRAAADALFAEIDSEFGKKKKEKPALGLAVRQSKGKVPQVVQVSEGQEANRISMLMGETSPWKPVARVAHLVTQICKCCKGEQEFLGNVLIRHKHKTKGYLWDCSIPTDPSHSCLPQFINTTTTYVEECPSCIRFDMHLQSVDVDNFQLALFS